MAKKQAAGILLYRVRGDRLEVFLIHPGGPYWKNKDFGAWSIPKGEFEGGEEPKAAAVREFREETGVPIDGELIALTPVKQRSSKLIQAWAVKGDLDADTITSNTFMLEWPPSSGRQQEFPEADRGGWFTLEEARKKILPAQLPLLDELERKVQPSEA